MADALLVLGVAAPALALALGSPGVGRGHVRARLARVRSDGEPARTQRRSSAPWSRRQRQRGPVDWASVVESIATTVRTGGSLSTAIDGAAGCGSSRLRLAASLHATGSPLAAALAAAKDAEVVRPAGWRREDQHDETVALVALQVAATVGGSVAASLDRAAATLRAQRSIRADRRVHSAQARMSARVLSALPVGFAAWCVATDDRVAAFLLGSAAGWACLAVGAALNLTGWWWMRRIVGGVEGPT
jgi:tight adherence protein B